MSASNLFDDLEGDDDIFYTPAKTPPKKKKQWMDDLLDDDKDLFGGITVDKKDTVAVVAADKEKLEETEAKKPKSGGGLFDDLPLDDGGDAPLSTSDGQASNSVNGYKDEEFVVVSHDEVPSREEAERTANPPPDTDTTEAEHDGPNSDLFNQNVGYEERARIRREQRRKRAQEKEHSSKTPSPTSPPLDDTKQDRDKRSTTPSPSPGIEETTQVFSGRSKSQSPIPDPGHVAVEPRVEKADSSTPTPEPPAQQPKDDSSEQIWQLTKSLERVQSENGYLKSENERLSGQVKTLQDKVAQLEKQLADRDKKEEVDSAANKNQVANLQEQLKSKDKEIEELRAVLKKSESPHHASVTTVVSVKKTPHSPRTKLRAGVDKGRPITSVADSVKKFGGAGATEVKRSPVPPKPKQSSPAHVKLDDKHTTAKKPSVPFHSKPSPPSKPRATVHHDKPDAHPSKHSHAHHPHPSAKDHTHHPHSHSHHTPHAHHPHPHKPEPANRSAKVTHKKPHPHHHAHSHATTSDKKESEKQDKKMEEEKKTEEVTVTKEEPKPEPEPVAPPADAEPPSEPKPEAPAAEVKPSEKKEEETTIQQLEKDTTRAQRVISLFENKGTTKPEQEQAPAWKVNAQQQRTAKDKEEREKETARQKEQEQEEKEKQEAEEKSRTSSNASSHKDEPVIVNGSVETTTAESANDEKEETDGGIITKPKTVASASSNVTKSTSALPPATKNTSNKNEEIKIRDNKMKKTGSASTIIPDPKKRLMVEEKGKRTSWAAPKREECAVCNKVVYVMERLEADKVVYHKTCFKCTVCNKTLSTGTYAALQGKTYCKVHFKQLFKMKGNYDEGFGREQHKTKWIKKDGETEA